MAETKLQEVPKTLTPIAPSSCQLKEHAYRSFDCRLPKGITVEDVENPALYVHLARQLQAGSEIRVMAEDESFIAWLYVIQSHGNDVIVKLIHGVELEEVDDVGIVERFEVKLCGRQRYCIIDTLDGSKIKTDIATQKQAVNDRDDHVNALAR